MPQDPEISDPFILDAIIEKSMEEMVSAMKNMVAIPSISPLSGGSGESKRADYLRALLESMGFNPKRYDYYDGSAIRSNLVVKYGSMPSTIWLIAHIDTVSPGDLSLWSHDPFDAFVKDGFIYGRGTSDNGQDVIAGIYALKALRESGLRQKYNFGLALVADEEVGSTYGIQKLIGEGIFKEGDMFIVPDAGSSSGDEIEIAEKGLLWLKFTTVGRQVHASTPGKGINAYRHAAHFIDGMESYLYGKYNAKDSLFDPDCSTFEITKHEPNVGSVNIIPGTDVSYMDCRVLPCYKLDSVLHDINELAEQEMRTAPGLRISIEVFNREDPAQPTSADSPIVKALGQRIKEKLGVSPRVLGIGGGTCALFFRRLGFPVAVWNTTEDTAHQPNEYCKIESMLGDAKVFASLFV
ncbi:MAG: M20 family metallo-hydrolase [Candidatus Micrarchaeaceae archaeon]